MSETEDIDALTLVFLNDINYQKMAASWRVLPNKEKYTLKEWALAAGLRESIAKPIAHVLTVNNICNKDGIAPLAQNYLHNLISTKLLK
jgi:hypothetical protein